MMAEGKIVMEASLEDLRSRMKRVQIIFDGRDVPVDFTIPGAIRATREGPVFSAVVNLEDPQHLDALSAQDGLRVNVFPLGLEDTFIELFGPQATAELEEQLA